MFMQARAFTERCVLNREVRVLLHSADSGARAVGEVVHVATGTPGAYFFCFGFLGLLCGVRAVGEVVHVATGTRGEVFFVLFVFVFCLRAQRWCAWPQARQGRDLFWFCFLLFLILVSGTRAVGEVGHVATGPPGVFFFLSSTFVVSDHSLVPDSNERVTMLWHALHAPSGPWALEWLQEWRMWPQAHQARC